MLHKWVDRTRDQVVPVVEKSSMVDYESFLFVPCAEGERSGDEVGEVLLTCASCSLQRHLCQCVDLCCVSRSHSGSFFVSFLGKVFTFVQDNEGCL